MDYSKFSVCISQCDPQDGGATMDSINGQGALYNIVGYHKGTAFPDTPRMSLAKWEETKKVMDVALVATLREGGNIKDIGKTLLKELDEMEANLVRCMQLAKAFGRGGTTAKWWKDEGERMYEDMCGKEMSELKAMWFGNIHMLLKLRVIEDGEMEGWLFIPAFVADRMGDCFAMR